MVSVSKNNTNVLAEGIFPVDSSQICASVIPNSLEEYDVGLEDSFCDAQEFKLACNEMKIPDPLLQSFGNVFNFSPETYLKSRKKSYVRSSGY